MGDEAFSEQAAARRTRKRWTRAAEAVFLQYLAAGYTVRGAAHAAGFSHVTAFDHRNTDGRFARAWRKAYRTGYERIEMLLIENAVAMLGGQARDGEGDGAVAIPRMTVGEALGLLKLRQAAGQGGAGAAGRRRPVRFADVEDAILKQLSAIEAQRAADAARGAA